jgi:hypothetical protein
MLRSVTGLVGVVVVGALAFAGGEASQPGPAGKGKQPPKSNKAERIEIGIFERDAKEAQVARRNGVTFTVRANAPRMLGDKLIELFWTIEYSGPRSPLVIIKPQLDVTGGGQTMALFYAKPPGKDHARVYGMVSLVEWEPLVPDGGICLPFRQSFPGRKISRDWFLSVPSGKKVSGSIVVAVRPIKDFLMGRYPKEFDAKRTPTFFIDLSYTPFDRAEDLNLDAWTGDLTPGPLVVRGLPEW